MPMTAPAAEKETYLEEIVVTAERRTQNQQDVPTALQAFTGRGLERRGADGFEDYVLSVPGNARFQVSLPAVNSVCNPAIFGTDEAELAIIRMGFQEAMVAEARKVCEMVPASELATLRYRRPRPHGETGECHRGRLVPSYRLDPHAGTRYN